MEARSGRSPPAPPHTSVMGGRSRKAEWGASRPLDQIDSLPEIQASTHLAPRPQANSRGLRLSAGKPQPLCRRVWPPELQGGGLLAQKPP